MNCKHRHTSYVPLHGHSTFSFGDGVTRIDDLMKRIKEIGADACALTEHGNMSSFLKFYKASKSNNIKPIIGCELYLNDAFFLDKEKFIESKKRKKVEKSKEIDEAEIDVGDLDTKNSHFLAYAKNYEGLKNLLYLSNSGFENFYYKPLVSSEEIYNKLDKNNIITTGCLNSEFSKLILKNNTEEIDIILKKYKDKFEDNFYLEIHINGLPEQNYVTEYYKNNYKRLGIKPVFALDYHYANSDDWYIQYLLYVIKGRKNIKEYTPDDWFYGVRNLYIKEIDDIYKIAEENQIDINFLEESIDSTFEIKDKIDMEIPLYKDNFPHYTLEKKTSIEIFEKKLIEKFQEKIENGLIPKDKILEYQKRLDYEKEIIISKNFVDYFLILDDLLNNFVYKIGGATGAGRGSAGGSLILFVLGITKIDPVKWDLIFERFVNPSRMDPPDIDIDFDSTTHKQVETYLKEKYGENRVCHIGNFNKFGSKSLIKDLCRIFSLDYMLSNKLTAFLGIETLVSEDLKNARKIIEKTNDFTLLKFLDDNYEKLSSIGDKMTGMVRQVGRHASGILISNKDLNVSDIPILRLKGELITGVQEGSMDREVSELGYLKLDILGLTNASVINDTIKLIEKKFGIKNIENDLIKSNFDDEKVWKEFSLANCQDIFQFGSDGMISLIKEVQPKNIQELCAINALYRPANIEAGMINEYIFNKKNPDIAKEKLNKIYSGLWDLLKETYGAICYQEQLMIILREVGGFSLAEADNLRKLLKKFYKVSLDDVEFLKIIKKFEENSIKRGVTKENANSLLQTLSKYSEYSFNKSHSFSYSINAYISMYLKIYYPKEYFSTLFNYSDQSELFYYFKLSKAQNVKHNEFEVNKADKYFSVDYERDSIKIGLNCVKGIQQKDIDKILAQEINSLEELLNFVKEQKFGKKAIENLTRLQYFKKIFSNSKGLEELLLKYKAIKVKEKHLLPLWIDEAKNKEDYSTEEKLQFEKDYLGFYLSEHPFFNFQHRVKENFESGSIYCPTELKDKVVGKYYTYGIINAIVIKKTKSGKEYFQLILEDERNQININIWKNEFIENLNKGNKVITEIEKNSFGFNLKTKIHKIQS